MTHPFESNSSLAVSFLVDKDTVRTLARISGNDSSVHRNWKAAVDAGFEKLVATNSLVTSYFDTVMERLVGHPISGLVLKQELYFTKGFPVYAQDTIDVEVSVEGWNPLGRKLRLRVIAWKAVDDREARKALCHGFVELDLSTTN